MPQLVNARIDLALGARCFDVDPNICRDEMCQELALHTVLSGKCIRRRVNICSTQTRSKVFSAEPWRAYCRGALRESVLASVSSIEPRSFGMIWQIVQNDYGSCCDRTVHRHLTELRSDGTVVRMDFRKCASAYLLAGSRLLRDPDLVFDQIMSMQACEAI